MKRYQSVTDAFYKPLDFKKDNKIIFDGDELRLINDQIPDFTSGKFDKVTETIAEFYNVVKFPNYDDVEDFISLFDKGRRSLFSRRLDDEIGWNKNILELGCGTGQLSLFLSRGNSRTIYAVDLSERSLVLGEEFRKKNEIDNVYFLRSDVFDLKFQKNYFDFVVSNGVLHHTKDAEAAFRNLVDVTKPGGFLVIGLYHKYGRTMTRVKQKLATVLGDKIIFFDKTLRLMKSDAKKFAWMKAQFFNPHETHHLPGEVFSWFQSYGVDFINLFPFFDLNTVELFEPQTKPSTVSLFINDLLLGIDQRQISEGGFFIVVGRKRSIVP